MPNVTKVEFYLVEELAEKLRLGFNLKPMALSAYHQNYIQRSDEELKRRAEVKERELQKILEATGYMPALARDSVAFKELHWDLDVGEAQYKIRGLKGGTLVLIK